MSTEPCVQWRGTIALLVLDSLDERERTSVLAHLDGCADCSVALGELREVADVLSHLDTTSLGPTAQVPAALASNVLGELRGSAKRSRRRRTLAVSSIAAVLVAVASLATWLSLTPPRAPAVTAARTIDLRGAGGATATALLRARPWGTAITLTERGLAPGTNYVVSLRSSTGSWWAAGTYHADSGKSVTTQLSCAVPMRSVAGVEVLASDGRPVLSGGQLGRAPWSGGVDS
jgi:hypothetical protein